MATDLDKNRRAAGGANHRLAIADWKAGSILRAMRPRLRNADYDGAIQVGVRQLADVIVSSPLFMEFSGAKN